ncbi:MAG TPA: hypothetical protein VF043_33850 [Ktedonobacteraceae bacterium]
MEKPPQTWRELLGTCMAEADEGRRIARELGINEMTLTRWVKTGTNPHPQTLRRLLTVLPQHSELQLKLIDEEFAGFSTTLAGDVAAQDISTSIPSEFYRRVHHTCAALPKNLRFIRISTARYRGDEPGHGRTAIDLLSSSRAVSLAADSTRNVTTTFWSLRKEGVLWRNRLIKKTISISMTPRVGRKWPA